MKPASSAEVADKLVHIADRARNLKGHGLDEGISTRMLIYRAVDLPGVDPSRPPVAWRWCARSPTTPTCAMRSMRR